MHACGARVPYHWLVGEQSSPVAMATMELNGDETTTDMMVWSMVHAKELLWRACVSPRGAARGVRHTHAALAGAAETADRLENSRQIILSGAQISLECAHRL